jgi:hypothetical protein
MISRHCAHSPLLPGLQCSQAGHFSHFSCLLAGNIPVADLGFVIPPGVGLYKNEVWKRGRCANAYPWQLYMPIAQPGRASAVNRPGSGDCCCVNCRSEGNFRFLHTTKESSYVRAIRLGAEKAIQEATLQPQFQGTCSSESLVGNGGPASVSALPLQAEHPSSKSPLTLRQWPPRTICRFVR